jgi:hypothetical protein
VGQIDPGWWVPSTWLPEVAPPKRNLCPSNVILPIREDSSSTSSAGVGLALGFRVGGGSDLSSAGPADRNFWSEGVEALRSVRSEGVGALRSLPIRLWLRLRLVAALDVPGWGCTGAGLRMAGAAGPPAGAGGGPMAAGVVAPGMLQ